MENQVSQQLLVFAQSILLGLSIGVLYDLLRPFRLRFPRLTTALDSIYCLAVGFGSLLFVLHRAAGEMRGYFLLGIVGGAVMYFCGFSPLLQPVWKFWADCTVAFGQILSIPLHLGIALCKNFARRGKNLFYFAAKCYTIRETGCRGTFYKGGSCYGRQKQLPPL